MQFESEAQAIRIAIALTALRHKPRNQSIHSYVLDLRSNLPTEEEEERLWRERALALEQEIQVLRDQYEAERIELAALRSQQPVSQSEQASSSAPPPTNGGKKKSAQKKQKKQASDGVVPSSEPRKPTNINLDFDILTQLELPTMPSTTSLLTDLRQLSILLNTNQKPNSLIYASSGRTLDGLSGLLLSLLPPNALSVSPSGSFTALTSALPQYLHAILPLYLGRQLSSDPSVRMEKLNGLLDRLANKILCPLIRSFAAVSSKYISELFMPSTPRSIVPPDIRPHLLTLLRTVVSSLRELSISLSSNATGTLHSPSGSAKTSAHRASGGQPASDPGKSNIDGALLESNIQDLFRLITLETIRELDNLFPNIRSSNPNAYENSSSSTTASALPDDLTKQATSNLGPGPYTREPVPNAVKNSSHAISNFGETFRSGRDLPQDHNESDARGPTRGWLPGTSGRNAYDHLDNVAGMHRDQLDRLQGNAHTHIDIDIDLLPQGRIAAASTFASTSISDPGVSKPNSNLTNGTDTHGIGITAGPSPSPYTAQTKMARKDSVWYLCTVMHILLAVVLPLPISDHREDDEVCLLFGPSDFGQGTDDERERGKEDEGSGFGLDACMDVNEGRGEHVNARTDGRRKEGTTMNGNCSTLLREAIFSSLSELLRRSTYPLHPIPHTPSPTSSAFSSSAPFSSSSAPSSSSSIHSSSFTSSSMFLSPHTAQSPNSSPQPPDREVLIPSSITEGVNSGEGHVHTSLLLPRACVDECGEIEEGICLVDPGDGVTQVDGRGVTETSGNPPTQNTRKRKRTVLEETHEDMQEAIQNKRNVRRRVEGDEHSTFEQRRMKRRKEMSELEREMILAVIERVWLCV